MSSLLNSYASKDIGTAFVQVYTAPAGKSGTAIGANVANTTNSTIYCDIMIRKSGVDYYLIKGVYIPAGTAYVWSGAEQKIVLDSGDSFLVKSTVAASCDTIVSIAEVS